MFRLFRKSRQEQVSGNDPEQAGARGRVSKYVLYALGEIALVVLGILIALQVDNWNDDREKETEFRIALSNLQVDLKNDMGHFEILDSVNADNFRNAEVQMELQARPNTPADIAIIQQHTVFFMNLDYTRDTYTSIVNSDVFHHSRNHRLKVALSDYYREAADTQELFERINEWLKDLLFKDSMLRYRFLNAEEALVLQDRQVYYWLDEPYSEQYLALSTWLSEVKRTSDIRKARFEGLRQRNQLLQEEIHNYLNSH